MTPPPPRGYKSLPFGPRTPSLAAGTHSQPQTVAPSPREKEFKSTSQHRDRQCASEQAFLNFFFANQQKPQLTLTSLKNLLFYPKKEDKPNRIKMSQSKIRQNFHSNSEAFINKQINMELYASYVYLSMVSIILCLQTLALPPKKVTVKLSCSILPFLMSPPISPTWRKALKQSFFPS